MRDPRKAYHEAPRNSRFAGRRNMADLALEDARSMRRHLGKADQNKFEEYFDSIRTIEVQMDR